MTPATQPRRDPESSRLLVIDPAAATFRDARVEGLRSLLAQGDLLVVNDAATLPASLQGTTAAGEAVELRLAGGDGDYWTAVLFGDGDWRVRTEDRPPPPTVAPGDRIRFGADLAAEVGRVWPLSPRLVDLRFDTTGAELWSALYRHGRPVQYSYLRAPVALSDVQTVYAARPWAVEPPSAGKPLTWRLLRDLDARGVRIAAVTHGAGLSSTGDPRIDGNLPLPERYQVPPETAAAVAEARAAGGRVVAAGTTAVRALEASAVASGRPVSGTGVTDLRIGPGFHLRVVDGILSGMHEPGTSHFAMLGAFAPEDLLAAAHRHAEQAAYLGHEFGDSLLILAGTEQGAETRAPGRASAPGVGGGGSADPRPRPSARGTP